MIRAKFKICSKLEEDIRIQTLNEARTAWTQFKNHNIRFREKYQQDMIQAFDENLEFISEVV